MGTQQQSAPVPPGEADAGVVCLYIEVAKRAYNKIPSNCALGPVKKEDAPSVHAQIIDFFATINGPDGLREFTLKSVHIITRDSEHLPKLMERARRGKERMKKAGMKAWAKRARESKKMHAMHAFYNTWVGMRTQKLRMATQEATAHIRTAPLTWKIIAGLYSIHIAMAELGRAGRHKA